MPNTERILVVEDNRDAQARAIPSSPPTTASSARPDGSAASGRFLCGVSEKGTGPFSVSDYGKEKGTCPLFLYAPQIAKPLTGQEIQTPARDPRFRAAEGGRFGSAQAHASGPVLRATRVIVITTMSPQDVHVVADLILDKPIDEPVLLAAVADLMPPSARARARR